MTDLPTELRDDLLQQAALRLSDECGWLDERTLERNLRDVFECPDADEVQRVIAELERDGDVELDGGFYRASELQSASATSSD